MSTLTGVWKTLVPTVMDDSQEFKTADVWDLSRELELEVEPENVNELLQSPKKLQRIMLVVGYGGAEQVASWDEMKFTSREEVVKMLKRWQRI